MKIAFYSPYLPNHFGGGEKYFFDTALTYAAKHQVFIVLPANTKKDDLEKIRLAYQEFLHCPLDNLKFIISPFGQNNHRLKKIFWTASFDVFYYVTDGSAFFSLAKKSIMHIQVPLTLQKKTFWEKAKFNTFKIINANSTFTKKIVEKYWGIKVNLVIQPGVDTKIFAKQTLPKEKIILNVGRFFDQLHCKNQLVMVEFFRQLINKYPQDLADWQLILIGKVESQSYVNQVRKLAKGLPIKVITDADFATLRQYYQKASIYWHATGFYDDPLVHPEKMEHFGISTVEAMAAGAVPVVINKGGQIEILGAGLKNLAWLSQKECLNHTLKLIRHPQILAKISTQAQARAEKFNLKTFQRKTWQQLEKRP